MMPVSLAPARICCKFWNTPRLARRLVAPKLWGYAGAGGLDWITAPSRALRRAWLPLPRPAQSKPALPHPAPLLGFLLALALLARAEGIREWTAEVLPQNRPMLALLRGLGLPLTLVTGRELVFVRLDLSALDTL